MKECEVKLMGGLFDCSKMPDGKCALMDNDGVPGGELSAMPQTFSGLSTDTLRQIRRRHSRGGFRANDCKASSQIVTAATDVLDKR